MTAILVVASCVYMMTTLACTPIDTLPLSDMELCGKVAEKFIKFTPNGITSYCIPIAKKIQKP